MPPSSSLERPRQRARHGEPADASAVERITAATAPEPAAARLVAVESPAHGVLVYARPPLADLEARSLLCAITARFAAAPRGLALLLQLPEPLSFGARHARSAPLTAA